MGFGEKVQADIKRLAITERLQLLKWMQIMVDEDLTRQGAVALEQARQSDTALGREGSSHGATQRQCTDA